MGNTANGNSYNGNYNNGSQQQQNSYGSNLYGWLNGGQANGQSYYNMMNMDMQQDGKRYGYYNDYGEYEVDQTYMPCDEYVCKDYYTYCSDLYEPNYKTMYNDENGQQQYNQYQQTYQQVYNNGGGGGGGNGYKYYDYDYNQQQEENELYQFLECTEYINEYGQQYFVGPHCASDHYTISLGVFSDENCVDYLGETISLSKVLGYGYDDESFFHLPHECISCDGAQQFQEDDERYNEMYMGQGVYGEYVEAPNEEFDDVVAMCAA